MSKYYGQLKFNVAGVLQYLWASKTLHLILCHKFGLCCKSFQKFSSRSKCIGNEILWKFIGWRCHRDGSRFSKVRIGSSFREVPVVCRSAGRGQPVWLTVRGCTAHPVPLLLLFISGEALKPLSTSPVVTRGHLCISQPERKRDTSLLRISRFYSWSDFPSAKHSWQKPRVESLLVTWKRERGDVFRRSQNVSVLNFPVGKINPRGREGEETVITGTSTCTTRFTLFTASFLKISDLFPGWKLLCVC